MTLLPYATFEQAVEGAKIALPIALDGVDRILAEQRLFGQALLTVGSYAANVGLRSDPQASYATAKEFAELKSALQRLTLPQTVDLNKPQLPDWLVDLIKLLIEKLIDLLV